MKKKVNLVKTILLLLLLLAIAFLITTIILIINMNKKAEISAQKQYDRCTPDCDPRGPCPQIYCDPPHILKPKILFKSYINGSLALYFSIIDIFLWTLWFTLFLHSRNKKV